jgi:hypothetical protein
MVAPVKKLREVFVLHPVMEKKPLSVFQNSFSFSRNPLRKMTGQNWKNGGFEFLDGRFFWGKVVFRTPLRW